MAFTLIFVSLFIPRFTAVCRIQAVSRSDEGPASGHDDNASPEVSTNVSLSPVKASFPYLCTDKIKIKNTLRPNSLLSVF